MEGPPLESHRKRFSVRSAPPWCLENLDLSPFEVYTVASLECQVPREWFGAKPAEGDNWVQIWDQRLQENFGSITYAVIVRLSDFEAGQLDRCAVVMWQ